MAILGIEVFSLRNQEFCALVLVYRWNLSGSLGGGYCNWERFQKRKDVMFIVMLSFDFHFIGNFFLFYEFLVLARTKFGKKKTTLRNK